MAAAARAALEQAQRCQHSMRTTGGRQAAKLWVARKHQHLGRPA
jgi:hypothetical protein